MARIVDLVRLPEHIEAGARVGPVFSTSVVTFSSGSEETNSNWQEELLVIDAGYGIMDKENPDDPEDSYMSILDFFRARKGRHRAFLFRDLTDYFAVKSELRLVTGSTRTFQVGKYYDTYFRRITRPVEGTLIVFKNDALVTEDNYTIQPLGRIVFNSGFDFSVPDGEVLVISATFEFDIPVRFDQDELSASITHIRAGEIPDVKITQIRE